MASPEFAKDSDLSKAMHFVKAVAKASSDAKDVVLGKAPDPTIPAGR